MLTAPFWKLSFSVGIVATLGALGVQIAACSSSSPSATPPVGPDAEVVLPQAACTNGGLEVAFSPMYSGYIPGGKHTFQVPALVGGSNGSVTWSADSTMVGMMADSERPNEVLITVLSAGNVVINVKSNDNPPRCGSSILEVTAATEADWEIGSARYNDGKSLHLQGGAVGPGSPLEQGGVGPACTNCHVETATNSIFVDVSHTPEQTGGFSDQDLINIITKGDFPDGGYFDSKIVSYIAWHNFHRWADITSDQLPGIIAYLRSLTPNDQKGAVDFNNFNEQVDDAGEDSSVEDAEPESGPVDAGPGSMDAAADAGSADGGDATAGDGGDAATRD